MYQCKVHTKHAASASRNKVRKALHFVILSNGKLLSGFSLQNNPWGLQHCMHPRMRAQESCDSRVAHDTIKTQHQQGAIYQPAAGMQRKLATPAGKQLLYATCRPGAPPRSHLLFTLCAHGASHPPTTDCAHGASHHQQLTVTSLVPAGVVVMSAGSSTAPSSACSSVV